MPILNITNVNPTNTNTTEYTIIYYISRRENWTIKQAEHWRTDAFELWCWRRPLRVSWTARRSNHSILKEINPEDSLEGLMLRLKLQFSGHLMQRANSLEKTLMLGKIESRRRRGSRGWDGWMVSPTQWMWVWANMGWYRRTEKPGLLQFMGLQRIGHDLVTEQQQSLITEKQQSLGWDKKARGALGEELFPPVD